MATLDAPGLCSGARGSARLREARRLGGSPKRERREPAKLGTSRHRIRISMVSVMVISMVMTHTMILLIIRIYNAYRP